MAIDATEGGANANSYGTTAEATAYFAGRLNATGYTDADGEIQEQALRQATTFLDARITWIGDIKDQTTPQALAWPRVYDFTVDTPEDILVLGEAIPKDLKNAQFEFALYMINNGEPGESNSLDSIKVGSLNIDFNEFEESQMIPDSVWSMITYLGTRFSSGSQVKHIKLAR